MRSRTMLASLLALALTAAPALSGVNVMQAAREPAIRIEAEGVPLTLRTAPIRQNGTLLVPLREIAEALSAKLEAKDIGASGGTIKLTRRDNTAELSIGSKEMRVNGRPVMLHAAPKVVGGVTMVPLRAVSEALGVDVEWDGKSQTARIGKPAELPVVGSLAKLKELLEEAQGSPRYAVMADDGTVARVVAVEDQYGGIAVDESASSGASSTTADVPAAAADGDYAKTNVQVDGVDEADWAKTDGAFIYQLSGSRIFITDIRSGGVPMLAAKLEYDQQDGFYPQEMYVSGGKLVVIGQYDEPLETAKPAGGAVSGSGSTAGSTSSSRAVERIAIWPGSPVRTTVKALVYTLSDAGSPSLERELELEGSYLSSRMVGSELYLISTKYNNVYTLFAEDQNPDPAAFEAIYRDSAAGSTDITIPLDTIRYFPGSPESSTMLIGAVDLGLPSQAMQVSAYLGAGGTVYASPDNLYVAVSRYHWPDAVIMETNDGEAVQPAQPMQPKQETEIYKFRMDSGRTAYAGKGAVPGTVLNQFSMDEHNGYFRIATTTGSMWALGEAASKNNLYVLDGAMGIVGKLEGLAPGERIYSARFMGGRAYLVTFRSVDPLFAIDLRDPAEPKVLGQLKIPGYSDYLHPYDENHLIGFGKETVELPSDWAPGGTTAYYQGMKVSLFDVTDVTQPKEKFKEIIGDRGTGSELLYNHKALLFDRSKGLMAFPVDLMEVKNKPANAEDAALAYGELVFQGAYVYHVDLHEGFKLRGRITHLSADELTGEGKYGYDYAKTVRRILYAGGTLYTLSDAMVKANAMDTLEEKGSLAYPLLPMPRYDVFPADKGIMIVE